MQVEIFIDLKTDDNVTSVPTFNAAASAGDLVTASSSIDEIIDINEMLIAHPAATFFARVSGDTCFAGINDGDIVIIDTSIEPQNGNVICVANRDEIAICEYLENRAGVFIKTATGDISEMGNGYSPENQKLGVITRVIRAV